MKKNDRLRRHAEYQQLYKSGKKYQAKHMSYFFTVRKSETEESSLSATFPHPSCQGPRVGLTVGRIMGNAVTRNRIKRRLRAAVRLSLPLLHTLNVDIALHPRRGSQELAWPLLQQDVATVFRTIARLSGESAAR